MWIKLEIVYSKLRGLLDEKSRAACDPIERGKILLGGGHAPQDRANYIPLRNRNFIVSRHFLAGQSPRLQGRQPVMDEQTARVEFVRAEDESGLVSPPSIA